jgi:hypothetical protein
MGGEKAKGDRSGQGKPGLELPSLRSMDAERSPKAVLRRALQNVFFRYAVGVVLVIAAFGLRKVLQPVTGTGAPFVLFFGAVAVTSLWAGPGPGVCATLLSIPLGAYSFVVRAGYPPSQAALQAALFSFDGLIVAYLSFLMIRARRAAESTGRGVPRDRSDHEVVDARRAAEILKGPPHEPRREGLSDLGCDGDLPNRFVQARGRPVSAVGRRHRSSDSRRRVGTPSWTRSCPRGSSP